MPARLRTVSVLVWLLVPLVTSHNVVKRQESPQPRSREVSPGIYSFTANGQYISMFVVTREGVMVFDPMNRKHSEAMLAEIRKITQAPIKYLFYSHNHWDHTSGGEVFRKEGAKIVSHVEAYDYLLANPNPEVVRPDMTWSGDRFDVSLGDFTVELHYLGLSHGLGMTTFVLQRQRVGFIADIAVPNRALFSYLPDFNIPGLLNTLEQYSRYEVDTIVFTHAANPATALEPGTQEDIRFTAQYVKDIQDAVKAELAKGTNPFTIPATLKLDQYSDLALYDQWFSLNVQAVLFDLLLGPVGWHKERSGRSLDPCTVPVSTKSSASKGSSSSSSSNSLPTYWSSSSRGGGGRYSQSSFNSQINKIKSGFRGRGGGWKKSYYQT